MSQLISSFLMLTCHADLHFRWTASAKINVYESSTDVKINFLMNVLANITIFDFSMRCWFAFWRNVSAKINVFESATDVENQFLMNILANFIIFDFSMRCKFLFGGMSQLKSMFLNQQLWCWKRIFEECLS